jgi:hypothetical protein
MAISLILLIAALIVTALGLALVTLALIVGDGLIGR